MPWQRLDAFRQTLLVSRCRSAHRARTATSPSRRLPALRSSKVSGWRVNRLTPGLPGVRPTSQLTGDRRESSHHESLPTVDLSVVLSTDFGSQSRLEMRRQPLRSPVGRAGLLSLRVRSDERVGFQSVRAACLRTGELCRGPTGVSAGRGCRPAAGGLRL